MVKHGLKMVSILFASLLLFACSGEKEIQLKVKVNLDGMPLDQALVKADGVDMGRTEADGTLSKVMKKKPGAEVRLSVEKELPGHRIEPWQDSFVVKAPKEGESKTEYAFAVELKSTKYFTVVVRDKEGPIEGATIKLRGKKVGQSGADGNYTYESDTLPKNSLSIRVSKKGYSTWSKTVRVTPGKTVEAALHKQTVLVVKAFTDAYGMTKALPGVSVSVNGNYIGKTDKKGVRSYKYKGTPGRKATVKLSASGYTPRVWQKTIVMDGSPEIKRFFYSAKPKPIRVGIYGYVSNTSDETLEAERSRIMEALGNRLFSYMSFKEVPRDTLINGVKRSKLNIDVITTKGWRKTRLNRTVDMIILGSVTKDDSGLSFETKVYTSNGQLLLSQINTVKRESYIKSVAKKIADNIIEQFPFEGTVVAVDGEDYQINLGRIDYGMSRGMEFDLLEPKMDSSGRASGYTNRGRLKIRSAKTDTSWGRAEELQKNYKVDVGDKVVRRVMSDEMAAGAKTSFTLSAEGGLPPDTGPLARVNVYLNGDWGGTTDSSGKVRIPARLGKKHSIVLYRHGYDKVSDVVYLNKDGETREFTLSVNNSTFKVDSEPVNAEVFIDDVSIGRTPMLKGYPVNFGFHTLKLTVEGDYREWEEVVEFNKKEVSLTGGNKVRFFKDYWVIGERAENEGDIDRAIETYKKAGREHPDYSIIRHRLGQLYMDDKQDYASAIREFEEVLSIPENKELIYKQFSVTYTNLGHAYYEEGNALVKTDRQGAATNFSKAIQYLDKAKQNTRFFHNNVYEEAVHDTYYYAAISYHKLYLITRKPSLLGKADQAWKEYFDFFPKKFESDENFTVMREGARKYWTQVQDLM